MNRRHVTKLLPFAVASMFGHQKYADTKEKSSKPLCLRYLEKVQEMMVAGDESAASIFHTIGIYFGYAIAHYSEFYEIRNLLVLGRVTSGRGGEIILERAAEVLKVEFPELSEMISLHTPDEKNKRHGQAIAAASLPAVK